MVEFGAFVLPIVVITWCSYFLGAIAQNVENEFRKMGMWEAGGAVFVLLLILIIILAVVFSWLGYLLFLQPGG